MVFPKTKAARRRPVKFDMLVRCRQMLALPFHSKVFEQQAEHRRMGLIGPAAPSSRVPTQSWPANHPDRWSDHDRSDHHRHRLNYDPPIEVATTIRSTMRAPAATFSGLNTDACKAEQRGEDRYRQDLSGHLLVYPLNLRKRRLCSIRPANMLIPR